jgi:hypothetical protein
MHILESFVPFLDTTLQGEDKLFRTLDSSHRANMVAALRIALEKVPKLHQLQ